MPIHDAPDERRYERAPHLGARDCLRDAEDERGVAGDALFLEDLGRLYALPRGRHLDQYAILADPHLLVHAYDIPSLPDGPHRVERQTSVDLRGDVSRHDLGDLRTEGDGEPVHGHGEVAVAVGYGVVDDVGVLRHRRRAVYEARVRGGILGGELLDRIEVAGVGDDGREFLELFDLGGHALFLSCVNEYST